jgi:tripartite-type tricarboxylate transporter receptor subunit TctC
VQFLSVGAAPVAGVMASGDVRALAAATKTRMALLPDLPTAAEAGLPGFESTTWFGLVAPAKTPKPIIDRLHKEIVKALNEPDLQGRLLSEGSEIGGIPPEEFKKYIINEIAKWTKVVKDAKIQVD